MQIIFSSKNVELTEGLKTFIERKLTKLKKYASVGLSNVFVNLDVDKSRKGGGEDAVVELVSDMRQKKVAIKEKDETFFKAFFSAVKKLERMIASEKDQRVERPRRR